jgi:hypothetical protein
MNSATRPCKADLFRSRMAVSLLRGEMIHAGRDEAAAGLETALSLVEEALGSAETPSEALTPVETPTRVDGAVRSPPAVAPSSTVSGSGGPMNAYEVRMTPHPRAVGSCDGCGGQLHHAPTCPKLAPAPGPGFSLPGTLPR